MPWNSWEDWNAGLYHHLFEPEHVTDSVVLLSDSEAFRETATEMLRAWPNAARHNLIHMWSGRNAWIGQATCCYAHQAPGAATRTAWAELTVPQQTTANRVARDVRTRWENPYASQTLFVV